jgi:peptide/nickel transport system ATP-binding protein
VSEAGVLSIDRLSIELPPGSDRKLAADQVSLSVARNEIVCLVGESGSGKSLVAYAAIGLLPGTVRAVGGNVWFEGTDLLTLSEPQLRRVRGERIAMIFQEPLSALNPVMRISDQIAEVLRFHGQSNRRRINSEVVKLLASVSLPDPESLCREYPFRLSGGQRQRVMIAMALALEPALLIADEPTTALDVTTQAEILRLLKTIQAARQMAILFITHDFGVVAEIADRVVVMQDGKVVETGTAEAVLNAPRHPYTQKLVLAVPKIQPRSPRRLDGAPVILEIKGLRKTYQSPRRLFSPGRRVEAVRNVSFAIRRGETLGLVGESGSGKSTVGRCIARLVDPDSGMVRLGEVELTQLSSAAIRAHRKRFQMIFQDPFSSLNPRHRVGAVIAKGPRNFKASTAEAETKSVELLRLVQLNAAAADRYPHEFSGGQRQRICIARALALEPELLIADEPVSALDVSVQAQIVQLLIDVRQKFDLAMLFITHDLRVASEICDTIAVMKEGEIVEMGPASVIFSRPKHPYTRALLGSIPGEGRESSAVAPA